MTEAAYDFEVSECFALDKTALNSFRQKRAQWVDWLDDDPEHAIWTAISGLVWRDTAFAAISKLARDNPEGPLNTTLIGEAIVTGHVTTQVLALRRLIDRGSNVISLPRLIRDLKRHRELLTRENFVCYDGLPYNYLEVMDADFREQPGMRWRETKGPKAWGTSQLLHQHFDRLTGVQSANRNRNDVIPESLIVKIEGWLLNSGAEEIAKWSHKYLAHAGMSQDREAIAHIQVTNNKITAAIRDVARVTEALSAQILYAGGRMNALMPVAQFDVFDRLESPVATEPEQSAAADEWKSKSDEWDDALGDVRDALFR